MRGTFPLSFHFRLSRTFLISHANPRVSLAHHMAQAAYEFESG
jgi:hypothetical protein